MSLMWHACSQEVRNRDRSWYNRFEYGSHHRQHSWMQIEQCAGSQWTEDPYLGYPYTVMETYWEYCQRQTANVLGWAMLAACCAVQVQIQRESRPR